MKTSWVYIKVKHKFVTKPIKIKQKLQSSKLLFKNAFIDFQINAATVI